MDSHGRGWPTKHWNQSPGIHHNSQHLSHSKHQESGQSTPSAVSGRGKSIVKEEQPLREEESTCYPWKSADYRLGNDDRYFSEHDAASDIIRTGSGDVSTASIIGGQGSSAQDSDRLGRWIEEQAGPMTFTRAMRSSEPMSSQPNQIIHSDHDPFGYRSQVTIPNRNSTVSDDSRAQSLSARTSSTASSERSTVPSDAPSEVGLPWHLQFAAMGIHFPVAQQIGPTYVLHCEFTFLGCDARFFVHDIDDWILHSLSHFNGRDPPRHTTCPFCTEEGTRFDFEGDVFVNWRDRMLHINGHFSQDPTLDFHQIKPDSLLFSYLVGPGVTVTANLASTFDPLSSRPILHGYGAPESSPAGNEGLLQYNNNSEKLIRPFSLSRQPMPCERPQCTNQSWLFSSDERLSASSTMEMHDACTLDGSVSSNEIGVPSVDPLSEPMSTCTADQTDWDENSDIESGYAHENRTDRQAAKCVDVQSLTLNRISSAGTILIDRLMSEFRIIFDQNWNGSLRHHGTRSPASGSGSNATTFDQAAHNISGRKRARGKDPRDPDDNDKRALKRAGKQPATASVSVELQYACPYRKHNLRKYCVQDWKLCALTPHGNVARVKAHLYNYHLIHQCPRCKQLFGNSVILESHTLAPNSCQVRITAHIDGITSKIKEQLQCRKKAYPGQTEPERWAQIYKTVFQPKSEDDIPSPYFQLIRDQEPPSPLSPESRVFLEYEGYFRRELPRHFHDIVESAVSNEIQPIEEQLRRQFISFLEEAQNRTFSSFRARFNLPLEPAQRGQSSSRPELGESSTAMLETFFRPLPHVDLDSLSGFNLSDPNFDFSEVKDDGLNDSAYVSGSPRPVSPQDQDLSRWNMEGAIADEAGPSSEPRQQAASHRDDSTFGGLETAQDLTTFATNSLIAAQYYSQEYSLMSNDDSLASSSDNVDLEQVNFEVLWTFDSIS